ncbi:MAG: hypothetical protein IKG90_10210 [Bacteroidales bacterium]|nr:hypothetical protein [Bacteroidales bacterium]
MRTIRFLLLLVLPLLLAAPASAQTRTRTGKAKPEKADIIKARPANPRTEGYYKDIFMDGGIGLNAYPDLPAADFLNLTLEQYTSSERTKLISIDTMLQTALLVGSPIDENGILLYPDGEPRFRMVYFNGGRATMHGRSLTEKGRQHVRDFVKNGGSYLGTCAGAFICAKGVARDTGYVVNEDYLGVWPGWTVGTGLENSYTSLFVEPGSPLLQYYDYGNDMKIDSVRHNGGDYAYMDADVPAGTEILLRFDGDTLKLKKSIHNTVSAWAWKENAQTGRVVAIGSHPERQVFGERLELMSALIRYALDGNGTTKLKGVLKNGEKRAMDRTTGDNDPAYTRVGDRQYHHFAVDVPEGVKEIKVELCAPEFWTDRFDLWLFADGQDFAFKSNARYKNIAHGSDKTLIVPVDKAGRFYISVFCATTVDTVQTPYGDQYCGRIDVLNGVPYSLKVTW